MKAARQVVTPKYDTDRTMKMVWKTLVRDFRSCLNDPTFCVKQEVALNDSIARFREEEFPNRMLSPVFQHKAEYQMERLFKRYIFADDPLSDEERSTNTIEKFHVTQKRIRRQGPLTKGTTLVIDKARNIVAGILGEFSAEEHIKLCKFGIRAASGVSLRGSYLDVRFNKPLTGSPQHIHWFKQAISGDDSLGHAIKEQQGRKSEQPILYRVCEKLRLSVVPKDWEKGRLIMPNTNIGGFYSYGIGEMIVRALSSKGIHLRKLQKMHRLWVKKFSRVRTHVTADLSSASDSFTSWLVHMLLPSDWWDAVSFGRIQKYTDGKQDFDLESFMTMGIGFTFQLQSLLFYSLIKAVAELSGSSDSLVSVYGDDLIYPVKIHNIVRQVLENVGFLLNKEKTYVYEGFRESCGEDYYRGAPVRPFQPEGRTEQLSAIQYESFLYKLYNGLRLRWEEEEIPQTFRALQLEILRLRDSVYQVPPRFPATSGIRVCSPRDPRIGGNGFWSAVKVEHDNRDRKPFVLGLHFDHLVTLPVSDRPIRHHKILLWDSLRNAAVVNEKLLNSSQPRIFNTIRYYDNTTKLVVQESLDRDDLYTTSSAPLKWCWKRLSDGKVVKKRKGWGSVKNCGKWKSEHEEVALGTTIDRVKVDRQTSTTSMWD